MTIYGHIWSSSINLSLLSFSREKNPQLVKMIMFFSQRAQLATILLYFSRCEPVEGRISVLYPTGEEDRNGNCKYQIIKEKLTVGYTCSFRPNGS